MEKEVAGDILISSSDFQKIVHFVKDSKVADVPGLAGKATAVYTAYLNFEEERIGLSATTENDSIGTITVLRLQKSGPTVVCIIYPDKIHYMDNEKKTSERVYNGLK